MGINDIFEPTKADFSSLAEDKTLYVKNVEQMVNINIRTQSMQQLKSEFKNEFPSRATIITFFFCYSSHLTNDFIQLEARTKQIRMIFH